MPVVLKVIGMVILKLLAGLGILTIVTGVASLLFGSTENVKNKTISSVGKAGSKVFGGMRDISWNALKYVMAILLLPLTASYYGIKKLVSLAFKKKDASTVTA